MVQKKRRLGSDIQIICRRFRRREKRGKVLKINVKTDQKGERERLGLEDEFKDGLDEGE